MGIWDFLGGLGGGDDTTKTALIDTNHKLTAIVYTIFQGYQTNVTAIVEEHKAIKTELVKITNFLKEKSNYE